MRRFLLINILIIIFGVVQSNAQCGWTLTNNCGSITAQGGLCSGSPTIFCIGDSIGIENNTSSIYDDAYICWGDGRIDSFPGGFTGCVKHKYNFPIDSCINIGTLGQINIDIKLGIKKQCGPTNSFHWITTPIAIKFKPKAIFNVDSICVGSTINMNNTSCFNDVLTNVTHFWDFGDNTTSTIQNPTHVYYVPGTYVISYTVTNSCGSSTKTDTIKVKPATIVNPVTNINKIGRAHV